MKKIVLVALLAAVSACSKKGSDCDAAVAKGMETMTANLKEHAPNPQVLERRLVVLEKVKTTLVTHCKADGWSADATACYAAAGNPKDMEGCKGKMTPEQVTKLQADIMQVMMSAGGMRPGAMGGMPPGMPGHPGALAPNTPPPPGGADPAAAPAPGAPAGSPPAAPAAPAAPATPPAAPPAAGSGTN
jgi:hypothetical protein